MGRSFHIRPSLDEEDALTDSDEKPLFDRVVVKLSGEALMGPDAFGLHAPTVQRIAADLKAAAELGVQVAVVVGGGNFFE